MKGPDGDDIRSLFRSTDWGETPLGAQEEWPAVLKTTVAIILQAATPMGICWGDDFILLYNDAWRTIVGDKHPGTFGRPASEALPDLWSELAPMLAGVKAGRASVRLEDRLVCVARRGGIENAWFSFSMDAIPLEDGVPGGILTIAMETTERVLALRREAKTSAALRASEARKAFLLNLSDALRPLADPGEVQAEASRILGRHLGADRVLYGEDVGDGEHIEVTHTYSDGVPRLSGRYRYTDFDPELLRTLSTGRNNVRPDVDKDPALTAAEKASHANLRIGALLDVPLVKENRLVAILTVHYRAPHVFTAEEAGLVEEVAERTWAAVERARAEVRERNSRQDYRTLFEAIDEGVYRGRAIFDAAGRCVDLVYDDENPAAIQMTGRSVRGRRLSEFGVYEPYWLEILGHTARTGEAQRRELHAAPDGRWYDFYVFKPRQSGADDLAVIFRDVTDRKRSEEHQHILTAELDHRVKNILAVVQSIARQSLGKSEDAERLTGRISALARSHAMLASNRWEGARFGELVESALAPYRARNGGRIVVSGPDLKVIPKAAQTLTLALHELVTNAAKYGALSRPEGQVTAAWELTGEGDDRRLLFCWTEHGGPTVEAPNRKGFGSRLMERSLAYELEGKVAVNYAKEGLTAAFDLPIRNLRVKGAWQPQPDARDAAPVRGDPSALHGKRILLVEDEQFVAEETADALRAVGCSVIGPVSTLERALQAAVRVDIDAAILDVNLNGEMIWPAALALQARGVPFVFATGYSGIVAPPPPLADAPWVEKPVRPEVVVSVLAGAVEADTEG